MVPPLVIVNVRSSFQPTSTVPKSRLSGLTWQAPADWSWPVPVQPIAAHAPLPGLTAHVFAPRLAGEKRIVIVADCPALSEYAALPTTLNSAQLSLTVPLSIPPPLFVTVNCRSAEAPILTEPKAMVVALREHCGDCGCGAVGADCFLEQLMNIRPPTATAKRVRTRRSRMDGSPRGRGSEPGALTGEARGM